MIRNTYSVVNTPHENREDGLICPKQFNFLMFDTDLFLLQFNAWHGGLSTHFFSRWLWYTSNRKKEQTIGVPLIITIQTWRLERRISIPKSMNVENFSQDSVYEYDVTIGLYQTRFFNKNLLLSNNGLVTKKWIHKKLFVDSNTKNSIIRCWNTKMTLNDNSEFTVDRKSDSSLDRPGDQRTLEGNTQTNTL